MNTLFSFITSQIPMNKRSKIWIVEPNKNDVRASRKRIVRSQEDWPLEVDTLAKTTLGNAKTELGIREWDFYAALMKTELTYALPGDFPLFRTIGAYFQHHAFLKWKTENLRITQSGVFSRKDSARSSLAGRFGEALMYLYMVKLGYPYWDHLPSLAERLMEKHEYSRDDKLQIAQMLERPRREDGKKEREPDYAFENRAGKVALAEAKGAFINPGDSPKTAKKGLADGLKQLELWQNSIYPTPERCFAIGSYLREENDSHPDPSLMAVVDPEKDDEGKGLLEFPDDWIRRGNYAAWMRGMGLYESAEALAYGRNAELPPQEFLTVEIFNRSYAFIPIGFLMSRRFVRYFREFFPPFFSCIPCCDAHVLGIETGNFSLLEKAVNKPDVILPSDMTIETITENQPPDWFSGSIMPDGTMNAILHFDNGEIPTGTEKFRL